MHRVENPVLALGERLDDIGGRQEHDGLLRRCASAR
jgi:hypothetical protein